MAGDAESAWAAMTGWLTPTFLFLFLNLSIATIVLTSGFATQKQQRRHRRRPEDGDDPPPEMLARAPSLLDRVRSLGFDPRASAGSLPFLPEDNPDPTAGPPPEMLARAPSLLNRVRSFGFDPRASAASSPGSPPFLPEDNPEPAAGPPPVSLSQSLPARLKSFRFSLDKSQTTDPSLQQTPDALPETRDAEAEAEAEAQAEPQPRRLARASSIMDRLKSFGLSFDKPNQQAAAAAQDAADEDAAPVSVVESLKRSASSGWVLGGKEEAEESDRREPLTMMEPGRKAAAWRGRGDAEEDEGVDAKADDFINNFRRGLKLQRVDSVLRYREKINRSG